MPKEPAEEWTVATPWGKIAAISWGKKENPPMLLLHGFMDTSATFKILLDTLPDKYYYVAIDLPGHGKSDPLPPGILVHHLHMVEALRIFVDHMKWERFVYMSHSMGCIIGLFYNHLHRDRVEKMILIDPRVPLCRYYNVHRRWVYFYDNYIRSYYEEYQHWNSGKNRLLTYEKAISLVVRNRSLTEEQADTVLSRSLVPMGIDTYKLSWEPRMKTLCQFPLSEETFYTILTANLPPTLSVDASESNLEPFYSNFAEDLLEKCDQTLPWFRRVTVPGGHDLHITSAKILTKRIVEFLDVNSENGIGKSKL